MKMTIFLAFLFSISATSVYGSSGSTDIFDVLPTASLPKQPLTEAANRYDNQVIRPKWSDSEPVFLPKKGFKGKKTEAKK